MSPARFDSSSARPRQVRNRVAREKLWNDWTPTASRRRLSRSRSTCSPTSTAAASKRSFSKLSKLRASQINGCAYCVDMHSKDARVLGETDQRLYAVAVWREVPFFRDRERAALAWTESVTLIFQTGAPS